MASKKLRNRLYWALVNARADDPASPVSALLEQVYRDALEGDSDTEVMERAVVLVALQQVEAKHGPPGVGQVGRERPKEARAYVDAIGREFEERSS